MDEDHISIKTRRNDKREKITNAKECMDDGKNAMK